jgi:hypothetical protein
VAHQFTQIQIYTEEASEGRMFSVSIYNARHLWQVGVGHSEEERGRETMDGEDFYAVRGIPDVHTGMLCSPWEPHQLAKISWTLLASI